MGGKGDERRGCQHGPTSQDHSLLLSDSPECGRVGRNDDKHHTPVMSERDCARMIGHTAERVGEPMETQYLGNLEASNASLTLEGGLERSAALSTYCTVVCCPPPPTPPHSNNPQTLEEQFGPLSSPGSWSCWWFTSASCCLFL